MSPLPYPGHSIRTEWVERLRPASVRAAVAVAAIRTEGPSYGDIYFHVCVMSRVAGRTAEVDTVAVMFDVVTVSLREVYLVTTKVRLEYVYLILQIKRGGIPSHKSGDQDPGVRHDKVTQKV